MPHLRIFILTLFTSLCLSSYAQDAYVSEVRVTHQGVLKEVVITVPLDFDTAYIRLNGNGKYMETWKKLYAKNTYFNYYDEFGEIDDQGKTSQLGYAQLSYFQSSDDIDKEGKLKQLGNVALDYYLWMNEDKNLKIATIGDTKIDYFSVNDDKALWGKIASIGNIRFEYYASFADASRQGLVKKIGPISFDYYSEYDNDYKVGFIKNTRGSSDQFRLRLLFPNQ